MRALRLAEQRQNSSSEHTSEDPRAKQAGQGPAPAHYCSNPSGNWLGAEQGWGTAPCCSESPTACARAVRAPGPAPQSPRPWWGLQPDQQQPAAPPVPRQTEHLAHKVVALLTKHPAHPQHQRLGSRLSSGLAHQLIAQQLAGPTSPQRLCGINRPPRRSPIACKHVVGGEMKQRNTSLPSAPGHGSHGIAIHGHRHLKLCFRSIHRRVATTPTHASAGLLKQALQIHSVAALVQGSG